jgi:hypothetical protein
MIASACWAALGLIHALPAIALLRPALISSLYGIEAGNVGFLLLHHRAALFLAIVVVCAWAALRPEVRPLASVTVAMSMLSFLWLYASAGQPLALRPIAIADLVGLPVLALASRLAFRPADGA